MPAPATPQPSCLRPWRLVRPFYAAAAAPSARQSQRRRQLSPACRCAAPEQPTVAGEEEGVRAHQANGSYASTAPANGHRVADGFAGGAAAAAAAAGHAEQSSPPVAGAEAPIQPDLVLEPPPGGAPIYVFGCVHADSESPHIARFILEQRPHSVVVETATDPAHGSSTGNILTRSEALRLSSNHRTRSWAQMALQLESAAPTPLASHLWREFSLGRHCLWSEHLVYVAALAVGAQLVFGDRPKRVTYHRLLWCPTVEDLDAAYGVQSALNYHELVSSLRPFNDVGNTNCVHRVLILERDATLLHELHQASLRAGADAAGGGRGGCVVGVVGALHLAGMRHLWEGGGWRELFGGGEVLRMPDVEAARAAEPVARQGVRWALFRAVLRLTCRPDVIRDVRTAVGPVPQDLKHTYGLAAELYGSSRMLLAVLNREQLAEVCSGWRCDFYDVLAPLRAVRPVNGGPGFDEELVLLLRTLQFELDGPAAA